MKHYYYLHTNGIVHSDYVLCARWVSSVKPDSSSSLPVCSMRVLPPHLLLINCLLRILLLVWRAGPSPIPPSQLDTISLRVQAPSGFSVGYNVHAHFHVHVQVNVRALVSSSCPLFCTCLSYHLCSHSCSCSYCIIFRRLTY
jgi:hypothetical protein